jgi:FMN phosphatase YigB (HAD superfamily)
MIKNIVFDLGNVLISFKPADFLDKTGYEADAKNIIISDIFSSREWGFLDNGDITTTEAIEKISARSSLQREQIASVFNLRSKIMYPINRNTRLLPALKKRGFKLYFLSNFPEDIFDELFEEYDFFRFFDGGLVSSKVKFSAQECLFIDDIEINVRAADSVGMKGLCALESANLSELIEKELKPVSEV